MRPRSLARRLALQYLFMTDLVDGAEPLAEFLAEHAGEREEVRVFATELVAAVAAGREEIDAAITAAVTNWDLKRVAAVERNILRLGCGELRAGTAPPKVVIDEAITLAKAFGGKESGAFVNGILDRMLGEWQEPQEGEGSISVEATE